MICPTSLIKASRLAYSQKVKRSWIESFQTNHQPISSSSWNKMPKKKNPNNSNNWCWQNYERGASDKIRWLFTSSGGILTNTGAGERIKLHPADWYQIFVFAEEIKLLRISHWLPLSLYSSVDLVMRGEGAQNFPNTLGEIGRNWLCHNLLWGVYGLKPLPYTPVTPFPLRLKSFSKHQTQDYLLISF